MRVEQKVHVLQIANKMKKRIIFQVVVCFLTLNTIYAQDKMKYPFTDGINITFAEALQKIGTEWMFEDSSCSTGLYYVEIWFDKKINRPNIFVPDNIARPFADSIRKVFNEYILIWDTSILAKLSSTIVQPIYIDDLNCMANIKSNENDLKETYLEINARQSVATKESINAFFTKLTNDVNPKRYYLMNLCIIKESAKRKKWTK
jgi:hypothetical protein